MLTLMSFVVVFSTAAFAEAENQPQSVRVSMAFTSSAISLVGFESDFIVLPHIEGFLEQTISGISIDALVRANGFGFGASLNYLKTLYSIPYYGIRLGTGVVASYAAIGGARPSGFDSLSLDTRFQDLSTVFIRTSVIFLSAEISLEEHVDSYGKAYFSLGLGVRYY